jgi:2-polyprenyl-3-methyl-5-hydroxy-6-metoxy-1,4-benzoquinol methylase
LAGCAFAAQPAKFVEVVMNEVERYRTAWDQYWAETMQISQTSPDQARSIWENDWSYAAEQDLKRFGEWIRPEMPLIDFGCGNGRQTQFLAKHFKRVIGTDVSESAIALAKKNYAAPGVDYRVLDGFDLEAVGRLHAELGDVNVYMRTVLHQIAPEDRARFVPSVKTLLGKSGTLYLYELSRAADEYIGSFIQQYGVPDKLQRILEKGMSPGPVGRSDVMELFTPDFEILMDGDEHTFGGFRFPLGPNGALVDFAPPTYFAVVRGSENKIRN